MMLSMLVGLSNAMKMALVWLIPTLNIDGWLLSGQQGGVVDKFLDVIFDYLDKNS